MKRLFLLAARFYPRAWRGRYGGEFEALLDDLDPTWGGAADILLGAVKMHLLTAASYWKLAAAMAAAGVIAGTLYSFTFPTRYLSTAVVRFDAGSDSKFDENRRMMLLGQSVSRMELAEIIQRPGLDLYKAERYRMPMEYVVRRMREDLRIEPSDNRRTVTVSFAYPDQGKAQAVAGAIAERLSQQNATMNRVYGALFRTSWPGRPAPPEGPTIELVQPATFPDTGIAPHRIVFALWGMAGGCVAAWFVRRPRAAVRYSAFAMAGAAVVGGASFLLADHYTSTAVLRLTDPLAPSDVAAVLSPENPEVELRRLTDRVLSNDNLASIVEKPRINLYPRLRMRLPQSELTAKMRQDIRIQPLDRKSFAVSFTYADRYKAQSAVRELVAAYMETRYRDLRARGAQDPQAEYAAERHLGANLEVLDPASFPEAPVSPNRLIISLAGAALGLLTAVVRRPRRPRPAAPEPSLA